ncbi:diguanylate cyclase [Actinotalea sp. Marseille-Q4924]|uniref:GGDEF domain-containing protein n=1 Tax=Actinotalea sp. Marseille-Q4924 TaxID=2866571 RepID=UPI001CE3BA21|nr:GGDEF domain-containing protein [Actinotalea sp. Marseille-Q4924]
MTTALRHHAHASEVATLAKACLATALVCAFLVAVPFSSTAPRVLTGAMGVAGAVLGVSLWRVRRRCPVVVPHLVLLLATTLIGTAVGASTTPTGTGVTTVAFAWVAAYSAVFHSRRVMLAHLTAIGGALALGLWEAAAMSPVQSMVFVMATVFGVAWVLNENVDTLRADAAEDPLTGALSRRRFLEVAATEIARSRRSGSPLVIGLMDLDDFKRVNDEGGHAAGDEVLVDLVTAVRGALRAEDAVGRLGGDEFALLLPGLDERRAHTVFDRLRTLSDAPWTYGVAQWHGEALQDVIARADAKLYAAKKRRSIAPRRSLIPRRH